MKQYNSFSEYLAANFNSDNLNLSDGGATDAVIPLDDTGYNRISIHYSHNMLELTVFYGSFEARHGKAMTAFADAFNENGNAGFKLRYADNRLIAEYNAACEGDRQAIGLVEAIINYPRQDNEWNATLRSIIRSSGFREDYVTERVKALKLRAVKLEEQGDHAGAMRVHIGICEKYRDYAHMEFAAMYYGYGKRRPKWADFPINEEYQLECLMLAAEHTICAPQMGYKLAKRMGRTAECGKLIESGQRQGTWDIVALSDPETSDEYLQMIADCYRKGTGCRASEANAAYYDRLAAGERQAVFKDMLRNGFEPVFNLMNTTDYYSIDSLADLEGVSDGMKEQFLFGRLGETLELPMWFIPLINGLNPADRDTVLCGVKSRLQSAMQTFLAKVAANEYRVIKATDDNFIDYEDEFGERHSLWLRDLEEVQPCKALDDIRTLIADFKAEVG